jgi:hypothetical protein
MNEEAVMMAIRDLLERVDNLEKVMATHRHGYRWEQVGADGRKP